MFILDYFGLKREAFDSVANFSALSKTAGAQNVSCLRLCGRNIYPKSYQLSVSI